ncbi:hypothetical protein COS64_03265 [archaeon CG06_land_8_20_14_3_00_37_11]|nr:MAG: hypothetical protein COS64_03265 [archaeon CG06_land_8_20_14_3_00_37_11]
MELALFIRREKDITLLEHPETSTTYKTLDSTILEFIKNQGFDRIYFGSETCENCMPNINSVRRIEKTASEYNIGFTLVTPICTDYGIDYLNTILPSINKKTIEVIPNDFGVLYMLSQMDFKGEIIMGRLLAKSKKWPIGDVPKEFKEPLCHSPFGLTEYQKYLKEIGISAIEVDNRIEGYDTKLDVLPFKIEMHLPFVYLTSGRMCFFSGQEKSKKDKFGITKGCKRYCDWQTVRLNEQFYSNGRAIYSINNNIENLKKHRIDRVIISLNL